MGIGVLLVVALTEPIRGQDRWDVASAEIDRVEPAVFPGLPTGMRRDLFDMGCAIPQAWGSAGLHNVISGQFALDGQTDWVALCSRGGISEIVVFWGGDAKCPAVPRSAPDRSYLQDTGVDGIRFSRAISAVSSEALMARWTPVGSEVPPLAAQDAISDAFLEKGATAWYCAEGRWWEFVVD